MPKRSPIPDPPASPQPEHKRLTVTLPPALHERVRRLGHVAGKYGGPSKLVEAILAEHLERYERS